MSLEITPGNLSNMTLSPIETDDRKPVIDIFNHYIESSFAAYLDQPVPYGFFDTLMHLCGDLPSFAARNDAGELVGFGLLRPYHPSAVFAKTAEITYFLRLGETGNGIGRKLLDALLSAARERGLTSILASVSSANEGSIRFHEKNGFVRCGSFCRIGEKKGRTFDVVYLQKVL